MGGEVFRALLGWMCVGLSSVQNPFRESDESGESGERFLERISEIRLHAPSTYFRDVPSKRLLALFKRILRRTQREAPSKSLVALPALFALIKRIIHKSSREAPSKFLFALPALIKRILH